MHLAVGNVNPAKHSIQTHQKYYAKKAKVLINPQQQNINQRISNKLWGLAQDQVVCICSVETVSFQIINKAIQSQYFLILGRLVEVYVPPSLHRKQQIWTMTILFTGLLLKIIALACPHSQDSIIPHAVDLFLVRMQQHHHARVRRNHRQRLQTQAKNVNLAVTSSKDQYILRNAHVNDRKLELSVILAHQLTCVQVRLHDFPLLCPQKPRGFLSAEGDHFRAGRDIDDCSIFSVIHRLRDDPSSRGHEHKVDLPSVKYPICAHEPVFEIDDVAVEREGELREHFGLFENHEPGEEGEAHIYLVALFVEGDPNSLERLGGDVQDEGLSDRGIASEVEQADLVRRGLVGEPGVRAVVAVALVEGEGWQFGLVQIHESNIPKVS